MPQRRSLLAAITVALSVLLAAPAAAQEALTVFAAASLKNVMDEQGRAFQRAGGPPVRFSYAASSAIARQIGQGAPADIFISADSDWMTYVERRRLVRAGTRRDLLTNRLALIAPKGSRVRLTMGRDMPLAHALGPGRLAMAAPEAPAGKYGRAALSHLGVWKTVEGKVVSAENVRAALAYVSRGEAPLGIVYDTDAKADPGVRIVGLFPTASHPRIVYPAAVLAASKHPAAGRFMAYLATPGARAIFQKHGFTVLR